MLVGAGAAWTCKQPASVTAPALFIARDREDTTGLRLSFMADGATWPMSSNTFMNHGGWVGHP